MYLVKMPRLRLTTLALATSLAAGSAACDSSQKGRDASAATGQTSAEVSIRVDVPQGGAPSVSVLAFRATLTGAATADVLSVVDPLVGPPPSGVCERRDVAGAARTLGAQGARVDLEALTDVSLDLGSAPVVRPGPRVYPALAAVVSGVVAEAGPIDTAILPEFLTANIGDGSTGIRERLPLPAMPRVTGTDPTQQGLTITRGQALSLKITGPAGTFVELRPFGAPWALVCPIGADGGLVLPAADLDRLQDRAGRVPVSVEAVWRESRSIGPLGQNTRLSLELRSSQVVEFAP